MTNRNPVKQVFITFPHSNVDKAQFRDALLRFEPSYYKICEEKHKDGTPHLHAVVVFKNKYSKAFMLKKFKETYPNDYKRIDVKPVRSIKHSLAYLSKEDTEPLESGEFKDSRGGNKLRRFDEFARTCGYPDIKTMDAVYKEREQYIASFMPKLFELYHLMTVDYGETVDYEIRRIFERLCSKDYVSKQDITFILTSFDIKV